MTMADTIVDEITDEITTDEEQRQAPETGSGPAGDADVSSSGPAVKYPPVLFRRAGMEVVETRNLAGGVAAVYSARSPFKERDNEDSAALLPRDADSAVLAVADGVGGLRGGDLASALAVETLQNHVCGPFQEGPAPDLRTSMLDAIETGNQRIQSLALGSATTLAAVEIQGRSIRPYHVGDSMILVTGGRGKIKLQTVSHSPVGFAVESGLLDEAEAMHHEDRHLVSNVLGTPEMRIEIGPALELAPRDTLLLASDGLFDNLHIEEIVELIRKGPLARAVAALAQLATDRMRDPQPGQPSKPDDLTIVAFRRRRKAG